MKVVLAAFLVAAAGSLSIANAATVTPGISQEAEATVQAKRCQYGTYRDSDGKRRCRSKPRGSH